MIIFMFNADSCSFVCVFLFFWLPVRDRDEIVKPKSNVSSVRECELGFVASLIEDVCSSSISLRLQTNRTIRHSQLIVVLLH